MKILLLYGAMIGGALLGMKACNEHNNTRTLTTSAYTQRSTSAGLSSHQDCISYANGRKECYVIAWNEKSTLYADDNGDGLTDRIIKHGNRMNVRKLEALLTRSSDYTTHTEEFKTGDRILGQ